MLSCNWCPRSAGIAAAGRFLWIKVAVFSAHELPRLPSLFLRGVGTRGVRGVFCMIVEGRGNVGGHNACRRFVW